MKWILPIALAFFAACGSTSERNEEEDLKEEAAEVVQDTVTEKLVLIEPEALNLTYGLDSFIIEISRHVEGVYDHSEPNADHMLARFTTDSTMYAGWIRKKPFLMSDSSMCEVDPTIWYFDFGDSTRIGNALRNWFHEFGDERTEIFIGKDTIVSASKQHIWIWDYKILLWSLGCEYADSTKHWEKTFMQLEPDNSDLEITINCNGKLRWLRVSNEYINQPDTSRKAH